MTALTKDRNTAERIGDVEQYKVAASTKIFAGANVALNAGGYLVPASDTAGLKVVGRAGEYVDNSAGANGDKVCNVKRGIFEFTGSGFTIADIGKEVYASDDQTVALRTTSLVRVGRIVQFDSATSVWVDMREVDALDHILISEKLAGATAGNYGIIFIAPFDCELVRVKEAHTAAGTDAGAVTLDVEKLTGTQAPDGGTSMLASTVNLKGTANTVVDATLSATIANRQLAAGNRISLKDAGVLTVVGDVIVTLELKKI